MENGLIFNIQKYSIHDGPGIRTTVFFKGCPLNCHWCHNPEGIAPVKEIMISSNKCINCKVCTETCSNNAITIENGVPVLKRLKCKICGKCAEVCPVNAIEIVGREASVTEIMQEIENDRIFYEESGGGVTFSGGEPLAQHNFLSSLLCECKKSGIHTVLDTSGCTDWRNLKKLADKVDLFLYDIKLIDNIRHKKFTGRDNKKILYNLRMLSRLNAKIIVRIPVIPGINDDCKNIKEIGKFLAEVSIQEINLLPYHKIGGGKYKKLGIDNRMPEVDPPSDDKMKEIASLINIFGLKVKIGG